MSRKLPKNDVINARMGNHDNIKKLDKNANRSQRQKRGNPGRFVLLINNVTGYKNENEFIVKTAEAENNARSLISILDKINLKIIDELLDNGYI